MAESLLYSTDGKVLQHSVWKCVIDKLLKMSYSLVGRNIPSQQCGKDTFTGVTKKHCGLDTYKMCHSPVCGNVSSYLCGKDTFTTVTKSTVG